MEPAALLRRVDRPSEMRSGDSEVTERYVEQPDRQFDRARTLGVLIISSLLPCRRQCTLQAVWIVESGGPRI